MGAKYEAYIESEADGLDISVLAVVPDETPYKGILQLVHGMSEYKERYLPFMEYMAKKGYVCVIHDHRGHGKSVRALDDLGYMYGGGADAILKDIEVVNRGLWFSKQEWGKISWRSNCPYGKCCVWTSPQE